MDKLLDFPVSASSYKADAYSFRNGMNAARKDINHRGLAVTVRYFNGLQSRISGHDNSVISFWAGFQSVLASRIKELEHAN